jgi:hypothetical protein
MNQNLGRQWDKPKGPSPEQIKQSKAYHATLKPMKSTLRGNGYSYAEVMQWAKTHPKFAQSSQRNRASDVAKFHDQDPDGFMEMIRQEIP